MSSGDSPGRRRKDDPASAITGEQMENNVRGQTDPRWLLWAREMQALAQTGLALTRDPYDRERYQRLRGLAARIMTEHRGQDVQPIEALFAGDIGYATPKLDVRGAVFRDSRLLLVRETADGDRWTLPGGWADVNESPFESVVKEVREESRLRRARSQTCGSLGSGTTSARAFLHLSHLEAVLRVRDYRWRGPWRPGDQRGRILCRGRAAA